MEVSQDAVRAAALRLSAALALVEPRMRVLAAARALGELSAAETVVLLVQLQREAARSARAGDTLAALLACLQESVPPARREEIARAARERGETLVASLVLGPESRRVYQEGDEPFYDPRIEGMSLGHRRSLARSVDKDLLARLAHDKDPVVVRNILANPKTTENDVVRIAARRPAHAEVLCEVFRHPRWSASRAVRRALALNPYTPVEVALKAVALLLAQDLAQVAGDPNLHPAVRMAALERRRGRRGTE